MYVFFASSSTHLAYHLGGGMCADHWEQNLNKETCMGNYTALHPCVTKGDLLSKQIHY